MVGTIIPSLIAPDLVSVQAIDNKIGMVNIMQFGYGSDKGDIKAGDIFASPLAYAGKTSTYTAASVDGEEIDVNNPYLAYTPVRPGTLRVLGANGQAKNVTLVDPYTGEIAGGTGTDALAAGDVAYYVYDNESVPVQAVPQIKMDIKSLPVTAQSRKLSAVWAFDAAYELQKEYGQSMQDILAAQAAAKQKLAA